MLLVLGTFTIAPDKLSSARSVMERMLHLSRAEDGCEEYVYAADLFAAGVIHVKELWRDQTALDLHFASSHLTEWRASWPQYGIGDRNLRVFEVGASRPI